MVDPVQDVQEAQPDELQRGLVPAGIEPDQTRIAGELVGALAAGRAEGTAARWSSAEPRCASAGRIEKLDRSDSIGYSSSTSSIACCQTSSVPSGSGARYVGERVVLALERPVRRQRDPGRRDPASPSGRPFS